MSPPKTSQSRLARGPARREPWVLALGTFGRFGISVGFGAGAYLALRPLIFHETSILAGWDAGTLLYLAFCWTIILRGDDKVTRERSEKEDQSRYVLFAMVIGAACASLVAIGFMLGGARELGYVPRLWHVALAIVALVTCWLLIQTLFSFHYAHRYYRGHDEGRLERHGLKFPNDDTPDFLDFAYYAFVVGMTSQVSDVAVTTRPMRRLTLVHGVFSFLFNIAVLAMSINIIGDSLR